MGYAEDVGSGDARSALSNAATGLEVDFSKKEPTTEEIEQMRGAVKFFDDRRGIGGIVPDGDGPEVFFHRTVIVDREPARLVESEPVEFDAEEEERDRRRPE